MKVKLTEITSVIRSKNAGPYELTFDLMFQTREWFSQVCSKNIFHEQLICELFGISKNDIINIVAFDPANAIKITIRRPRCSGDIGETDVYGAQQHAPFLNLEFDL